MPAIWKGQLTFGPVSVPVELRTAVREHRIGFRMLAAEDQTPIKFERVRADNGEIVPWKEIIKGYEVTKGHYITLTEEDFDSAALEQNRQQVASDPRVQSYLQAWRSMFPGAIEIDVYKVL